MSDAGYEAYLQTAAKRKEHLARNAALRVLVRCYHTASRRTFQRIASDNGVRYNTFRNWLMGRQQMPPPKIAWLEQSMDALIRADVQRDVDAARARWSQALKLLRK